MLQITSQINHIAVISSICFQPVSSSLLLCKLYHCWFVFFCWLSDFDFVLFCVDLSQTTVSPVSFVIWFLQSKHDRYSLCSCLRHSSGTWTFPRDFLSAFYALNLCREARLHLAHTADPASRWINDEVYSSQDQYSTLHYDTIDKEILNNEITVKIIINTMKLKA